MREYFRVYGFIRFIFYLMHTSKIISRRARTSYVLKQLPENEHFKNNLNLFDRKYSESFHSLFSSHRA